MHIFEASQIRYKLKTGKFVEVSRLLSGDIALKTTDFKSKNKIYNYTTDLQGNNRQLIKTDGYKPHLQAEAVKTTKPSGAKFIAVKKQEIQVSLFLLILLYTTLIAK